MGDFDERDLLSFAEEAGFSEIHLELNVEINPVPEKMTWEQFLHYAANPKVPTIEEAMQEALTPEEIDMFILHLRPLVEQGQGIRRGALAFLWAAKENDNQGRAEVRSQQSLHPGKTRRDGTSRTPKGIPFHWRYADAGC